MDMIDRLTLFKKEKIIVISIPVEKNESNFHRLHLESIDIIKNGFVSGSLGEAWEVIDNG